MLNTNIYEVNPPPLNNRQALNITDVYLLYCHYYLIADAHMQTLISRVSDIKFEFYTVSTKATKY